MENNGNNDIFQLSVLAIGDKNSFRLDEDAYS